MDGKVVIVTGSSSGIGEATALNFSSIGCFLTIHGTDQPRLDAVAKKCKEISPRGFSPLVIKVDFRSSDHLRSIVEQTVRKFGRLDVLVNCAGIFKSCKIDQPLSTEIYSELMKVNLDAPVYLTMLAIPHLTVTRGCIINVSSSLRNMCIEGGFAYCTIKAALHMFTKACAVDLCRLNIRVNSVSPGPTATRLPVRQGVDIDAYRQVVADQCLVGRVGEPDDISRVIVFLASPGSTFITGTDIIVDGGASIKPFVRMSLEQPRPESMEE